MKEVVLQTTKRKAIPYIINLKCECGGNFVKSNPVLYDYETNTVHHTCTKCGKSINSNIEYPHTVNISNEPEEEYEYVTVLEGCKNIIGL